MDHWLSSRLPLAGLTTLRVGGPARHFARCADAATLARALHQADSEGWRCLVLGGGSNLLVADRGFDGLVLQLSNRELRLELNGTRLQIEAAAGCDWDRLVAASVQAGSFALSPLSGIPGSCGAAPIQNIGAYGVELSESLESIEVFDRHSWRSRRVDAAELDLSYRSSRLKRERGAHWIVLAIRLQVDLSTPAPLRYEELRRRMHESGAAITPESLRQMVLRIRAEKSMLLDEADRDSRSAGSFFMNPLVTAPELEAILARCQGVAAPQWPQSDGRTKLSAAWCIERAGFRRGETRGAAALSSRHVLALCNPSGRATAAELLAFAREIHERVLERLGVCLQPEACLIGFAPEELGPLQPFAAPEFAAPSESEL